MSKFYRISIAVIFVFGVVIFASSVSAEKWKWHGTSFNTDIQQMDVGDVEGHLLMIVKAQQLYVNETTGEKWSGPSVSTMDINPQANKVTMQGYGVIVDKDGNKIMRYHEGKVVGKNQWAGTYTYTAGTGKFEGIRGGGTFTIYTMGQGQPSYLEAEADVEVPAK